MYNFRNRDKITSVQPGYKECFETDSKSKCNQMDEYKYRQTWMEIDIDRYKDKWINTR